MSLTLAEAGASIVAILSSWDPPDVELKNCAERAGYALQIWKADVGNTPALRACFHQIWEAGVVPDILLNFSTINRRGSAELMTDEHIDLVGISRLDIRFE